MQEKMVIMEVKIIEQNDRIDVFKRLSNVDMRIMAVMWSSDSEFTSRQIHSQCKDMDWKLPALMKQLERLESKGFIGSDRSTKPIRYKAVISKTDYIYAQFRCMRDLLFNGDNTEFMESMLDASDMKPEDLEKFLEKLKG